ncbi:MAG: hypothetical protein HY996_12435 [Micrococcales bacterium]|nr:hypothetical protein [Micrococcales bacterium]
MSTIRNPSGPLPKSVYWRRRLLLLAGLIALVAVVVLIIVRPGAANGERNDGTPPAADKSTVTGAPTDAASPDASASATGAACKPANVKVVAVTDKATYASGAQPMLSMSITNSGSSACTFDVGTGAQGYVITSGTEKIWDSRDCQTDPTADVQSLAPGQTLTTQPFAWDRTRSATTTCAAARPAVIAAGASYHLAVSLGAAKSATTKQFILN